ncbi:MAG TPA: hypothetical protein VK144_02980 [Bacillota bacterium]|nr:hypothetical protein [Bacillota bacterium]
MVSSLFFIAENSFFEAERISEQWKLTEKTFDWKFMSIASDPFNPRRIYAGTFDHGLLVTEDQGESWQQVEAGIIEKRVMSVAVSPTEKINGYGVIWAGTEPSNVYRSEDGGNTWTSYPSFLELPSEDTWFFPPRPHTHHVHAIQPDLYDPEVIFIGIELGGVLKSTDKGRTWEDRKENSQFDCHSLTMNQFAKGRLYEAAGGGYAETIDGGKSWNTYNDGLGSYTYLVDVAVDSSDPNIIVASGAKGPRTAYNAEKAETFLFRKVHDKPWEVLYDGLPEEQGSTVFSLATDPSEPETFFAVNNRGIYRSTDQGVSWENLGVEWKQSYENLRIRKLITV